MVETEIKRNPKVEGDKIIIESEVRETMDVAEFRRTYGQRVAEQNNIENTLATMYDELRRIGDVKETDDIKQLKEKLQEAQKLIRKEELQDQIKKMEKRLVQIKEEMKKFNPLAQKLQENDA